MREMEPNHDEDTLPLPEAVNVPPLNDDLLANIKQEVEDEIDPSEYLSISADDHGHEKGKTQEQVDVKDEELIVTDHNIVLDEDSGGQVLLNGLGRQLYSSVIEPGSSLSSHNIDHNISQKKIFTTEPLKQPKNFACEICFKTFAVMYKLQKHKRVHTGEKPYQCQLCLKNFAQNENLQVHMRSHTGEKPFSCETCRKSFATKSALVTHRRVHTGERPYHCEVCGKAFSTSSYLVVHRRYHSDEKPFVCNICSKSFKTPSLLRKHMTSHTAVRILDCEACGKSFKLEKSLRIHQKIGCKAEALFNCSYCGKTSTDRSSLARHVRLHTGERPYSCDICDASYSDSTALKSHKRIHTSEKPYFCEICGMYFKSPNNLSRHKRNIHSVVIKRGSKNKVLTTPLTFRKAISVIDLYSCESR